MQSFIYSFMQSFRKKEKKGREKFTKRTEVHTRNSRNKNKLQIPLCRTATAQRSFQYRAVRIWNNLPTEIRSFDVFKNEIKNNAINDFLTKWNNNYTMQNYVIIKFSLKVLISFYIVYILESENPVVENFNKVIFFTIIHLIIHSFIIHAIIHSFLHLFIHSCIYSSFIHSLILISKFVA